MSGPTLEHVNLTVSDNQRSAALFAELFGWHIRWQGPSQYGGHTVHVGDDRFYLALYSSPDHGGGNLAHQKGVPFNHVGLLVDDLLAVKAKVEQAGLTPFGHERYEPGERFYFFDWDGIEYEIVSYA